MRRRMDRGANRPKRNKRRQKPEPPRASQHPPSDSIRKDSSRIAQWAERGDSGLSRSLRRLAERDVGSDELSSPIREANGGRWMTRRSRVRRWGHYIRTGNRPLCQRAKSALTPPAALRAGEENALRPAQFETLQLAFGAPVFKHLHESDRARAVRAVA